MTKLIYLDVVFIKFIMEQKDLTAKSLAEQMGVSQQTVHKYFNDADQSYMPAYMIFRFAKALEVPAWQLLTSD